MFRVLTCLTVEHDWRLVGVAAVLCLFASLAAVNLFNRARATAGRARFVWIIAAAIATGFGIWATHFVAMLAYEPGIPIAYSLSLTVLSLAAAAFIAGSTLSIAVYSGASWAPVVEIVPDRTRSIDSLTLSSGVLAIAIAERAMEIR